MLTLIPAYGRDYGSKSQISEDIQANKDFIIADMSNRWNGRPVNREQLKSDGYKQVKVRFYGGRRTAVVAL